MTFYAELAMVDTRKRLEPAFEMVPRTIADTPFDAQTLALFLNNEPNILELGPVPGETSRNLENLHGSSLEVQAEMLSRVVRDLPRITCDLEAGLVGPLESKAIAKYKHFMQKALVDIGEGGSDESFIVKCKALVEDFAAALPFNTEVANTKVGFHDKLKIQSRASSIVRIKSSLEAAVSETYTVEMYESKVLSVLSTASAQDLPKDLIDLAAQAYKLVCERITDAMPEQHCKSLVQAVHAIREFVAGDAVPKVGVVLESMELAASLKTHTDIVRARYMTNGILEKNKLTADAPDIIGLSVRMAQVKTALVDLEQSADECVRSAIAKGNSILNDAAEVEQVVGAHFLDAAKQTLTKALAPLKDLAGGLEGGKDWLGGATTAQKDSWQFVSKLGTRTLLKAGKTAALKPHIDCATKAAHWWAIFIVQRMCVCVCVSLSAMSCFHLSGRIKLGTSAGVHDVRVCLGQSCSGSRQSRS